MDYHRMAEDFFAALCSRPHGPWNKKRREQGPFDPSKGEVPVLRYLYENGAPAMPSAISQARQLSSARIANILAGLEKKGLVCRTTDENDRRKVLVTLTDKGRALAEERHREALEDTEWLLRQMGEEDAKELIRLEWKMTEIIRRRALSDAEEQ